MSSKICTSQSTEAKRRFPVSSIPSTIMAQQMENRHYAHHESTTGEWGHFF